jgi:hypothetical protein
MQDHKKEGKGKKLGVIRLDPVSGDQFAAGIGGFQTANSALSFKG